MNKLIEEVLEDLKTKFKLSGTQSTLCRDLIAIELNLGQKRNNPFFTVDEDFEYIHNGRLINNPWLYYDAEHLPYPLNSRYIKAINNRRRVVEQNLIREGVL